VRGRRVSSEEASVNRSGEAAKPALGNVKSFEQVASGSDSHFSCKERAREW